jgi:hypothetical protein
MNDRLKRIQLLVLSLTVGCAALALVSGRMRPFGIALGGGSAWLDFFVIKELGTAMFARRPSKAHIVSMAFAKSFVLLAVPAVALFFPATLVDGVSFAVGVTMLPVAIVADACFRAPRPEIREV